MNRIIIDCDKDTIRTAILDDKGLVELIIDEKSDGSLVGNIYSGVVKNILPNQFAFIDIGREKNAFLFLNDKKESSLFSKENNKLIIKSGNNLLVQVLKDETGSKGAYVSSEISFFGRLCVLIKTHAETKNIAISRKIMDEVERNRLKEISEEILPNGYDLILRTNSANQDVDSIKQEILDLLNKADKVFESWQYQKAPCIINKHENRIEKNIKDLFNDETIEVIINNQEEVENIKNIVKEYFIDAEKRIIFYDNEEKPIFHHYNIQTQIDKILNRKVWLKSGGFIIIEQTEACVVIDVNSGKFLGSKNHEQSSLKLNTEASKEIAKQIRLRNLSGIIIVDFIDMRQETSKQKLMEAFSLELKKDRISTNLVGITSLGLVELTRKKMREPLANRLLARF